MTKERLEEIRAKVKARLAKRRAAERAKYSKGYIKPRYDEVYFKGLEWLDTL